MSDAPPLTLFNSLTRQLEPFRPGVPGSARVYSCGPTVYARQHLGNMRAYIFADTLRRVLEYKGWPVRHVINITDVGHLTSDADTGDDKMERAAAREQLSAPDIADRYTGLFKADLNKLNVLEPYKWSLATDHIDDMVAFASDCSGNLFCFRTIGGGAVFLFNHDFETIGEVAPSFAQWIDSFCKIGAQ